jgi:5-methylthioadenosine/S-adenosylhomocysteine deaminase
LTIARRLRAPIVLPSDPECSVIRDGVVDVREDGRIGYCGPAGQAPDRPDVPQQQLTGILMPGLINTHAHSAMTVLRGAGGDRPLMSWLQDVIWPAEARLRPSDVYAGMLVGCLEMLQYGVTTSAEMYAHADQVAVAALDAGSRIVLTPAYFDLPGMSWEQDLAAIGNWIDADGLRFGPGERVELGYGPHSAYTLPPEALRATADAASERGALVHIHLAETLTEDTAQRTAFGSVPALLAETGLLAGRLLAAHSVHLSTKDIQLLAEHQTGIAHCPGSNAKLASGQADLLAQRAAGLAVGLGTDGPSSNDDLDLWEEMRLAVMLARLAAADPMAVTAKDALLMATRDGAEALGRGDLGRLELGAWADLVHVGVDGPYFVAGLDVPDAHLLANLVWAAGSRAVRDVWVAGEPVVTDAKPVFIDPDAAYAAAAAATTHLLTPARSADRRE